MTTLQSGGRVPEALLGKLVDGNSTPHSLTRMLAGRRALIFGVPGAFTPICTERHAAQFVADADGLKRSGFDVIICIAPDNPWAVEAWARQVDPKGKLCFLSDAVGQFAAATGLGMRSEDLLLGNILRRFVMTADDGVIGHLGIEPDGISLTCSGADAVLCAA